MHLSASSEYRPNTQDSAWKDGRAEFDAHRGNIGDTERVVSAISGLAFLVGGLARRNWAGSVLMIAGGGLLYRAISGSCPVYRAMGIDTSGHAQITSRLGRRKVHTDHATKIRRTIKINRSPHELYQFWRSLDNLPRIMTHLDSIQILDDHRSHWMLKLVPGAPRVEWDAEIINEVEDRRIGWKSLQGSDLDHAGSVEFKPTADGQRTWLRVTMQYKPPEGTIGSTLATWFGGDPSTTIAADLQRFKEQMEAGLLTKTGPRESS